MSKKYSDFSQLERISENIENSVKKKSLTGYNPDRLLVSEAKIVMESVLYETPHGKEGSNWWKHDTKSYYPLGAKEHHAGALRRGWVTDSDVPGDTEIGGVVTAWDMYDKVYRTKIEHNGDTSSMTFTNQTPYSGDVEWGHNVVFGKDPTIRGRVDGQYYTRDGIDKSEKTMKKAIGREVRQQLKEVFKI